MKSRIRIPAGIAAGLAVAIAISSPSWLSPTAEAADTPLNDRPVVRLALCLDTSGSMDGLIDSAKQKLWAVVNDLALAEPSPRLEVALLTFGNDGHNAAEGWVHVETPFTEDLDVVSERLFALETNGGTEYVGRVLYRAGALNWGGDERALRLAVVAGNEAADQDESVPFQTVCSDLKSRGIVVNAIYCDSPEDALAPAWREVAQIAGGAFASIDKDDGVVVIATPYDDRLGELSEALNGTYVPFGAHGASGAANQSAQDQNAAGLNSSAKAARAMTKASALYSCAWDLVDACKAGQVKVEDVSPADLPEALQALTTSALAEHIEKLATQRAELQAQVQELSEKRDRFIREEMKRLTIDESRAFDHAIRQAIRGQAEASGLRFPTAESDEPKEQAALPELEEWEIETVRRLIDGAATVKKGDAVEVFQSASLVMDAHDLYVGFAKMDEWEALTSILRSGRPGVTEMSAKQISISLDDRLVVFALEAGC